MSALRFLKRLFFPLQHCELVVFELLRLLKVAATSTTIRKELEEHPDYPSLLAVRDILWSYGVCGTCVNVTAANVKDLPMPFLAQLSVDRAPYFTVVSAADENQVTYIEPLDNNTLHVSPDDFSSIFTGYVLIPDTTESSGEKNYIENLRKENKLLLSRMVMMVSLPICVLVGCIVACLNFGWAAIPAILYTLISFGGSVVGGLLIWQGVDQYNPTLRRICASGKKADCGTVINSSAAKIFGISWSVIGFAYFSGSLISLLFSGIYHLPTLFVLAWLNVLSLPYIAFSVYYQSRVVKQWCMLCLSAQVFLALQFVVAFFANFYQLAQISSIDATTVAPLAFSFALPFIFVAFLVPALRKASEARVNDLTWRKMKYDQNVFQSLLSRQKLISEPDPDLGITIGDPYAKYKIVKVCNPYCRPCSVAHAKLEALIQQNTEVSLQIIFASPLDKEEPKYLAISHFMALAQLGNENLLERSLNDWYSTEKKDYDGFSFKYPIEPGMIQQDEKLQAMRLWCESENIDQTPTVFVNRRMVPDEYDISDLRFILC